MASPSPPERVFRLVLLRHGQSEWNRSHRFTGWADPGLTSLGTSEARLAGRLLHEADILPDIVHTSLQTRAIATANEALASMDRPWIPVRRHWRLNERHYGNLTGLDKDRTLATVGKEQFTAWRRGYDTPPPPIADDNKANPRDNQRYASVPTDLFPRSESLHDVLLRLLPYWYDQIIPDLRTGATVLIAAHGNSLRALCKHLDHIPDDAIEHLDLPTGAPLLYELDATMTPIEQLPTLARTVSAQTTLTHAT